jgi:hypothetical protein
MVMVKIFTAISTNFKSKKVWNCREGHNRIWFDHYDHGNFEIFGKVMVKFGLTMLTIA